MTIMDCRPFLAVGVSFLAAVLISFSRRYPNVRESWSVIASFIKFGLIISMVPGVLAGVTYEWTLFQITDTIGFTLRADSAGILFACLAALLWIPINFYSIGYMRCNNEHEQTGYFAAFAICMSSVMGIAMASNLLTFFFFYELLTIASYPLVLHKRNEEALLASRKYLIYTLISGQLFLAGLVAVYCISGTMDSRQAAFDNGYGAYLAAAAHLPDHDPGRVGKSSCHAAAWLAAGSDDRSDACQRPAACGGGC